MMTYMPLWLRETNNVFRFRNSVGMTGRAKFPELSNFALRHIMVCQSTWDRMGVCGLLVWVLYVPDAQLYNIWTNAP